jgi:hypothetical protein
MSDGFELSRGPLQVILGQSDISRNNDAENSGDGRRPLKDDGRGHAKTEVGKVAGVGQVQHFTRGLVADAELVLVHDVAVGALVAGIRAVGVARLARLVAGEAGERAFGVDAKFVRRTRPASRSGVAVRKITFVLASMF